MSQEIRDALGRPLRVGQFVVVPDYGGRTRDRHLPPDPLIAEIVSLTPRRARLTKMVENRYTRGLRHYVKHRECVVFEPNSRQERLLLHARLSETPATQAAWKRASETDKYPDEKGIRSDRRSSQGEPA